MWFFKKTFRFHLKTAFTQIIDLGENFKITDLYTELVNAETNEVLISYQPKEFEKGELPPVVEPPASTGRNCNY